MLHPPDGERLVEERTATFWATWSALNPHTAPRAPESLLAELLVLFRETLHHVSQVRKPSRRETTSPGKKQIEPCCKAGCSLLTTIGVDGSENDLCRV